MLREQKEQKEEKREQKEKIKPVFYFLSNMLIFSTLSAEVLNKVT